VTALYEWANAQLHGSTSAPVRKARKAKAA